MKVTVFVKHYARCVVFQCLQYIYFSMGNAIISHGDSSYNGFTPITYGTIYLLQHTGHVATQLQNTACGARGYTDTAYRARGYTDTAYRARGYTDTAYRARGYTDIAYRARGYTVTEYSMRGTWLH